ncbi:gamma-glutamyltransferase family protein [Bordetella pertussis]
MEQPLPQHPDSCFRAQRGRHVPPAGGAQAGLRILALGGNAADAAVASAATLALVEPASNGLGSDCFALVWDGARLHGLNASGTAPAAWSPGYFQRKHQGAIPLRGWDSVTIPGCVAGWASLHDKLGSLPFADVLAPAIEYAERGFAVPPTVQRRWADQVDPLRSLPGFAEHFLPHGRAPEVGEHFVLAGAAATLRRIAASGGRDFYEGETAQKLVAHAQAHEAALTLGDLRDYAPQWVEPISQAYRGHALHQLPPNGQGLAALIALGIVEHFDLASRPAEHPDTQHILIEAMKLAFADVHAHVADAAHIRIRVEQLLDPAYLAERARLIDLRRARVYNAAQAPQGGTVYLACADRNGMMVSFTQSNYMGSDPASWCRAPASACRTAAAAFSMDPDHPNVVGAASVRSTPAFPPS